MSLSVSAMMLGLDGLADYGFVNPEGAGGEADGEVVVFPGIAFKSPDDGFDHTSFAGLTGPGAKAAGPVPLVGEVIY